MSSRFSDREPGAAGPGKREAVTGSRRPAVGVPPVAERIALALPAIVLAALFAAAHPQRTAHAVAALWRVEEAQAIPGGSGVALASLGGTAMPDARFPTSGASPLRVCADPNNLPFSNARGEGFENALARLVGAELGRPVEYLWWAQRRGFVRNTLGAGTCDVTMGVPAHMDRLLTTRPYYRSTYVFVSRRDRHLDIRDFDDPRLKRLRIGVPLVGDDYVNPPPVEALLRRGILRNLVGFTVYGDYTKPDPPARILDAVARRTVDLAVVWGPLAGWYARREAVPLDIAPTPPMDAPFPLAFDIAMGVRRGDTTLRARLDSVIVRRRPAIDSILRAYGVPRADRVATRTEDR